VTLFVFTLCFLGLESGYVQAFFRGISFRLAQVGVVLAFGLGLTMSCVQLYIDFQAQEEEFDALISQVIEVASPPASRAIHTLDDDLSIEVVNGLLAYDFIYEVAIMDELGNVLASGSTSKPNNSLGWLAFLIEGGIKEYRADLSIPGYGDGASGVVQFKVDLDTALGAFYQRSTLTMGAGVIRNMVLVFLLFTAFYYLLTRPLTQMLHEIRAINPEAPGEKRITVRHSKRTDELTLLAQSSNQMLDAVQGAFDRRLSIEQTLRQNEEAIRLIINELPAIVGLHHLDGTVEFANHHMADFFGKTTATISGINVHDLGFELTEKMKAGASTQSEFEGYFSAADGKDHYLQGHVKSIRMDDEEFILMVASDISARKQAEEKMEYMAYHDALTNLPNRLHLVERLEHEIVRSRRHKYFGAVLFIDLDHFKNINDSLGHPVGDLLLKQVAQRLLKSVREEDLVARLSGDEFVIVLTVLDSDMETAALKAGEIAEKVRHSISQPYSYQDSNMHISCSIGVKVYADDDSDVHELLRYADTAMYQVKEKGRDAVEFFNTGMAEKVSRKLQLESELHLALEEKQFLLYFQPKVDVKSGEIIGAEVLLRWQHPERGVVSPAEFIPVLESSGLIVDVGRWIIRESCQNLQQLAEQGLWKAHMRLSVNISPRQFNGQDFVNDVTNILSYVDIPDNSLDFEVTESVVIHNVEETITTMTTLTSMGISFSLDDFGTGYSSISYLKRLPVSTLKVDYSFVRDIVDDHSDRVLVETIITMGKLLNLDVVAEGVEGAAQLEMLAGFGCHYYQGFYFSRPVPLSDFKNMLISPKRVG